MAEVVYVFTEPIVLGGHAYKVQVCGRTAGSVWEGWIEFESMDGTVVRTARETSQPNRADLQYWAGGLSITYLEGALARALDPAVVVASAAVATPHFSGPKPRAAKPVFAEGAVLDPYSVAEKGETLLRQQLGALSGWHLRNIVRVYELADESVDLEALTEPELIDLIVTAVMPTV